MSSSFGRTSVFTRTTATGARFTMSSQIIAERSPRNGKLLFFNDTATTEIYTLSLHDALPISHYQRHDGTWWLGGVSRAPLEEGTMARTAMALRVMQVFGTPAMKAELDPRMARARAYLANA